MSNQTDDICRAAQILYDIGLGRTGGNVSGRIDEDLFAITPRGAAADFFGALLPADLVTVSILGGAISGGRPSSEVSVHGAIYEILKWVGAVVHAHPQFLLNLSDDVREWPKLTISSDRFEGSVFGITSGEEDLRAAVSEIASTIEQGDALRYGVAFYVPRHGVFVASKSVGRAMYFINKLEENAHLALMSRDR